MSKNDEINYIDNVIQINGVERDAFHDYLFRKPYSDAKCWEYLSDVSQILKFLPAAPARVLDLGCGSGWTTEIFAASGYQALGLDIASDFVKLAQQRPTYGGRLSFQQHDYENAILETGYDAVVIFDALHHADSEEKVIRQAYSALKEGGVMIILEPGYGHSQTSDSLAAVKKYGTTEKDMQFAHYKRLILNVGFKSITQYLRLKQLPLVDVSTAVGPYNQIQHFTGLCYETASNGLTSLGVALK